VVGGQYPARSGQFLLYDRYDRHKGRTATTRQEIDHAGLGLEIGFAASALPIFSQPAESAAPLFFQWGVTG
jgi:hypothetical protein